MGIEVSKIDAATHQLGLGDKTVHGHGEFVPAITLAGAAEEILGKAVAERASFGQLKKWLAAESGVSEQDVSQKHLNRVRNWLKHWDEYPSDDKIMIEPDKEAVQYITRALSNFVSLDRSLPSEGPNFLAWLDAHPEMRSGE